MAFKIEEQPRQNGYIIIPINCLLQTEPDYGSYKKLFCDTGVVLPLCDIKDVPAKTEGLRWQNSKSRQEVGRKCVRRQSTRLHQTQHERHFYAKAGLPCGEGECSRSVHCGGSGYVQWKNKKYDSKKQLERVGYGRATQIWLDAVKVHCTSSLSSQENSEEVAHQTLSSHFIAIGPVIAVNEPMYGQFSHHWLIFDLSNWLGDIFLARFLCEKFLPTSRIQQLSDHIHTEDVRRIITNHRGQF